MQKYCLWLLGTAMLCCMSVWLWWPRTDVLVLRDDAGTIVLTATLPQGAEFAVRFTHSVAKSPVEEWFYADNGAIVLRRAVYQDFGAGLPHEPGPGQHMTFANGQITLTGFNVRLPQLTVRVGRVAGYAIVLPFAGGYRTIELSRLASPGAALTFLVKRTFFWGSEVVYESRNTHGTAQ